MLHRNAFVTQSDACRSCQYFHWSCGCLIQTNDVPLSCRGPRVFFFFLVAFDNELVALECFLWFAVKYLGPITTAGNCCFFPHCMSLIVTFPNKFVTVKSIMNVSLYTRISLNNSHYSSEKCWVPHMSPPHMSKCGVWSRLWLTMSLRNGIKP